MRAFSSCSERGLPFIVLHRLLIEVAPPCRAQALWLAGFGSNSTRALFVPRHVESFGLGIVEPMCLVLAGRFLTTGSISREILCIGFLKVYGLL